jgi:hypothetical protein
VPQGVRVRVPPSAVKRLRSTDVHPAISRRRPALPSPPPAVTETLQAQKRRWREVRGRGRLAEYEKRICRVIERHGVPLNASSPKSRLPVCFSTPSRRRSAPAHTLRRSPSGGVPAALGAFPSGCSLSCLANTWHGEVELRHFVSGARTLAFPVRLGGKKGTPPVRGNADRPDPARLFGAASMDRPLSLE